MDSLFFVKVDERNFTISVFYFSFFYRYIRVFCREIFLNKACKTERGFWMAQILKPYPMFFQARLLFILYGPTDLENGLV